ncbi:hypothetical protein BN1723_001381 [Verticillium longisporum]|uniref:Uncharacterized protein n=1 Tax=Verticillium longisporum TaxID=100787 RepID=A0A0G4NNX3_VERLO|nr:hypothetical protein BN1723_001381 [Verticillium longisporum]
MASGVRQFPTIKAVRSYVIDGVGAGGDYHNVKCGHWLIDSPISTPSSRWEKYRKSRTSWGINVLGSFFVEIEATDGTVGFATGFGGPPACWLAQRVLIVLVDIVVIVVVVVVGTVEAMAVFGVVIVAEELLVVMVEAPKAVEAPKEEAAPAAAVAAPVEEVKTNGVNGTATTTTNGVNGVVHDITAKVQELTTGSAEPVATN